MEQEKINRIKQILIKKRNEIRTTIAKMDKNEAALQNQFSPSELSNYDNHPAELGSELFQLGMNKTLKNHESHILKEIDNALNKVERGGLGKCEICGLDIPFERLEVLPYARLCVKCRDENTDNTYNRANYRPIEEKVIDSPFGKKYLNKKEDDEYEGLDILNDLMKYGSADSPQDMGGYHEYKNFFTNEEDKQGVVDKMDGVSNQSYINQLPD